MPISSLLRPRFRANLRGHKILELKRVHAIVAQEAGGDEYER